MQGSQSNRVIENPNREIALNRCAAILTLLTCLVSCSLLTQSSTADAAANIPIATEALWISNTSSQVVSEISKTGASGTPGPALSIGIQQGAPGKPSFDGSSDLWVPLCGGFTDPQGLIVAFKHSTLRRTVLNQGSKKTSPDVLLSDPSIACPRASAFDKFGNLWVSTSGSPFNSPPVPAVIVQYAAADLFKPNAKPVIEVSSTHFGDLRGISFDKAGDLWVADLNGGVEEFSSKQLGGGAAFPCLSVASSYSNPIDLAFDAQGNLWVAYLHGPTDPSSGSRLPGAIVSYSAADLTGSGVISPIIATTIGGPTPCSPLDVCSPQGVAFDAGGDLWVSGGSGASSGLVFEYSPEQLTQSGSPLAHVTLATNGFSRIGRRRDFRRLNFFSPGFLILGPAISP